MLATTYESASGGRLRLARLGSGPPLVLLHGYPDNLQIWSRLAPLLAERFETIAFDWPGMGHSETWPGGATPFDMAQRLGTLLDGWGLRRATLVGADMGAQPALAFAARSPERVQALVVMNSLAMFDEKTSWEIRWLRRFGWNRFFLRCLPWVVFHRAERTFLEHEACLPAGLRSDLWDSFRQPEVREYIVRMCAGYQGTLKKLAELYPSIPSRVLCLWGDRDKHFPVAHAERLSSLLPRAELKVLRGARHWMIYERAGEVAREILAFETSEASGLLG